MIDLQILRNICIAGAAFFGTHMLVLLGTHLWAFLQYPPI